MYIIAIAWIYVVLLMSFTEESIVAGVATFLFYGLAPLSVLLYLMGTPQRRRNRRRRDASSREPGQPSTGQPSTAHEAPVDGANEASVIGTTDGPTGQAVEQAAGRASDATTKADPKG